MQRKQMLLDFLSDKNYPPLKAEEIMLMLDIPFDDREELMELLAALVEEGLVVKSGKKKYASPDKLGFVTGRVSITSGGFGFVLMEGDDVFLPPSCLGGAMDGDTVLAEIVKKGERGPEGRVRRVIRRSTESFVGTLQKNRNFSFVVPDNHKVPDIFISSRRLNNARNGQKVVARITKWQDDTARNPEGEVTEILGYPDAPGVDMLSVMRAHGLREEFPHKVMEYCENIDSTISSADIAVREDFRSHNIITIDGVDSKDFDDAVEVDFDGTIYTLGVHIADVTHYVTEGSPPDREAFARGTSVYFPGSVVPMLPRVLSNGICSLNPGEDRLTLSVIMQIDTGGRVVEHRVCQGIIQSKERMTYDDVSAILEGNEELKLKYKHIYKELRAMEQLSIILRQKRFEEGSIDFDFPEAKIVTDNTGRAVDVFRSYPGVSNRIIEEFMLCANRVIAEEFFWADVPFVYRIHEKPAPDRLKAFADFVRGLGYRISPKGEPHPGELARIVTEAKGSKEEAVVNKVLLRSLMKARYSPECLGHFGLSFKHYCHFTSPIRRYPDLAIHRIIKEFIACGISEKRGKYYGRFVADASLHSSDMEIRAMEAQREAEDIKKAEYMEAFVGEHFEANITGCTGFGFYAELENGVEGLVRLSGLDDDYYVFDEEDMSLRGEHTGRVFRIGDLVGVIVAGVDKANGNIEFSLI